MSCEPKLVCLPPGQVPPVAPCRLTARAEVFASPEDPGEFEATSGWGVPRGWNTLGEELRAPLGRGERALLSLHKTGPRPLDALGCPSGKLHLEFVTEKANCTRGDTRASCWPQQPTTKVGPF